ncbi:glutamate/tyrosine decarboxylase-like PLP-dependent enzyme [Lentzea atacamensis]|uniref:Glutamate/tyrosine decarboxylase-like PLP-dependent enzyme n=1 Tax=Lentzea atacamensis TaxID=531938 RepID=A0ABX9EEU2_9PSEU|nr:pyridoxal-dependent decarboxylase [Lentzea atacamensis]RAS67262.1 glutamate/tyrosine decarboxylase-like PLP-dependent enzyme [Lentzea atacamensis]
MSDRAGWIDLPPDRMRELGHQVIDLVVDHLTGLRGQPVRTLASADELRHVLDDPVPEQPGDPGALVEFLTREVLPRSLRLGHPGCLAFIPSANNFLGVLGDLLASGFNVSPGAWPVGAGPAAVELVTARWLATLLGLPQDAGGLFTPGGTLANLTALAAARDDRLGSDATGGVLYCSDQTHPAVLRACHVLGLRQEQVRMLPAMSPDVVRQEVRADRRAGLRPFLVLANAGTTGTGAIDPLPALAALCREEQLWLHVDGAHGAAAALTERGRKVLRGLDEADSIVIDPHKWLFQPYEIGCVLVRDPGVLHRAFTIDRFRAHAGYLAISRPAETETNLSDHGVQFTTEARALKLWLSLKGFGVAAFRAAIDRGLDHAEHVAAQIADIPELDLVAGPSLGIVCLRYRQGTDDVQAAICREINESGDTLIATTTVDGALALRLCTINPRLTPADLDGVLAAIVHAGRSIGRDSAVDSRPVTLS